MPFHNPFRKEKHREDEQQQQQQQHQQYAPPPGPPPSHMHYQQQQTGGPSSSGYGYGAGGGGGGGGGYGGHTPQPPPPHPRPQQQQQDPPPYHDWTVIPDTALLPPPPPINYDASPTANASAADGEAAFAWCNAHPLRPPHALTPAQLAALAAGRVALAPAPACYTGEVLPHPAAPGRYKCRTHSRCRDALLTTALPLYAALAHSPLAPPNVGAPRTVYFEVRVLGVGGIEGGGGGGSSLEEEADAGIALGFVAPPYPPWRLPGWQRGSLGVHGDDGRRYVNDTFGGQDFTTAFAPGETVGLGVAFGVPRNPPEYGSGGGQQQQQKKLDVEVFFTRNGKRAGGWDLHEELDERHIGGTAGLDGECDLFAAVGVFGGVDFEVFFNRNDWLYRPEHA